MRLTDEKSLLEQVTVEQFRQNLALLKAEEIEIPKKWVLELLNTIEALRKEKEQIKAELSQWSYLGDIATTELIAERLHYIPTLKHALKHENEQLRAQVAAKREALRKAREALKGVNVVRCPYCWGKETHSDKCEISKAIETIDKAIGGKEDV